MSIVEVIKKYSSSSLYLLPYFLFTNLAMTLDVTKHLGRTEDITASTSSEFTEKIYKYVATDAIKTEKSEPCLPDTPVDSTKPQAPTPEPEPALWPLIKRVRIWCRAKALKNGAILVDLPGTEDSDEFRAKITQDYMRKCSCFWIVAPISRYVLLLYS